jgi:hypothetical protein
MLRYIKETIRTHPFNTVTLVIALAAAAAALWAAYEAHLTRVGADKATEQQLDQANKQLDKMGKLVDAARDQVTEAAKQTPALLATARTSAKLAAATEKSSETSQKQLERYLVADLAEQRPYLIVRDPYNSDYQLSNHVFDQSCLELYNQGGAVATMVGDIKCYIFAPLTGDLSMRPLPAVSFDFHSIPKGTSRFMYFNAMYLAGELTKLYGNTELWKSVDINSLHCFASYRGHSEDNYFLHFVTTIDSTGHLTGHTDNIDESFEEMNKKAAAAQAVP